jgi:glycosyltransferase involved in cell wall biosynthesis
MSQPTISLVVRALNEAEHLPALFTGLLRQEVKPTEVILVDSGSTDDSVAIATAHGARIVHIKPEDFSFGRSLNVGCAAAIGEILVFVSAHVYPLDEYWLGNLVAPFEDPAVVLSYGRQTGGPNSAFSEVELMRRWFPDRSDPDQQEPFCNNANCAVRRSEWERRHYDEELTGLEDLAWAKQAHAAGGKIAYVAEAGIAHIHDESFARLRNRYRREAIAHRRIFNDQHMGALEATGLFVVAVFRDYLAAVPRRKFFRNLWSIPRFRAAQYLGTYEGFRAKGDVSIALKKRFYYPKGFTPRAEVRRPESPSAR